MNTIAWQDITEMYRSNQSCRAKYSFYYNVLHRLCTEKVRELTADYNDFFSQLQAVCRSTNYPLYAVDQFRWRARQVMLGNLQPEENVFWKDVSVFVDAYAHFTQTAIPDELKSGIRKHLEDTKTIAHVDVEVGLAVSGKASLGNRFSESHVLTTSAHKRSTRFVLCEKDEQYLYAVSGQLPRKGTWKISFTPNAQTLDAAAKMEEGMQFNAITFTMDENKGEIVPEMLILEPDYLIDVSSLCKCLQPYGHLPLNYLLNQLSPGKATAPIILGNITGQFLDDCINDSNATYLGSMQKAFKSSMIDITACEEIDAAFFDKCKLQFQNIKRIVGQLRSAPGFRWTEGGVHLEPSFFCEALGIQGRMDCLQCNFENLIEMKSGQWDSFHRTAKAEHLMQMILYKEILYHNLGVKQLSVAGYVLYSLYSVLQEQRTAREMVQLMMQIRNGIVMMQRDLKAGNIRHYLENLKAEDLNSNNVENKLWKDYSLPELKSFLQPIQQMDALTADYFYTFFTFVAREQYMNKVGDGKVESTRGMSSLWNADLDLKIQNGDIMIDLTMMTDVTLAEKPVTHVVLMKPHSQTGEEGSSLMPPNFRVSDPVILYQRNSAEDSAVTRQVIRCSVECYDNETITLMLNHPQTNPRMMPFNSRYAIEHDFMDAASRQQFRGLYTLLTVSQRRRDLLLCQCNPEFDETTTLKGHYSHSAIDGIVLRAKQAKDYFLLVGPPGTGKTSVYLKSMVQEFMNEEQSLLLLAYTNRAVDEICESLGNFPYIRLGRELTCNPLYHSHLLDHVLSGVTKRETVRDILMETPILVGTVNTVTSHLDLFRLRQFDIAIFDEASQILEPQMLGLLCDEHEGIPSIGKFIMIGDHKQLPAVVLQPDTSLKVTSACLQDIGLKSCGNSLFERLHSHCLQQGEIVSSHTVALLAYQGRMHPEIAEFVNKVFYENALHVVGLPHQSESLDYRVYNEQEQFVATSRFGFVDVPLPSLAERQPKVNLGEAEAIAQIVMQLVQLANKNQQIFDVHAQLGIIVPFRRQIVAVRQALYRHAVPQPDSIMIDTVERYQGSQKDVIIYGTTITQRYELDTLSDVVDCDGCLVDRRLNVALTRARKQLFVVGNAQLLSQNILYRKLLEFTETHHLTLK